MCEGFTDRALLIGCATFALPSSYSAPQHLTSAVWKLFTSQVEAIGIWFKKCVFVVAMRFFYVNCVILHHLQCCFFSATLVAISDKSLVKSPRCSFMATLLISTNLVLKINLRSTIPQWKKVQKWLSRCEMSTCLTVERWEMSDLFTGPFPGNSTSFAAIILPLQFQ